MGFAQDLAAPSAKSFAHRIPHEMIEDLTKIAESEKSAKEDKKKADNLKGTYKLFLEENEAALRGDWVRVGNLRVRLEVSRALKIEIVD